MRGIASHQIMIKRSRKHSTYNKIVDIRCCRVVSVVVLVLLHLPPRPSCVFLYFFFYIVVVSFAKLSLSSCILYVQNDKG
jgi:hypothetical protein